MVRLGGFGNLGGQFGGNVGNAIAVNSRVFAGQIDLIALATAERAAPCSGVIGAPSSMQAMTPRRAAYGTLTEDQEPSWEQELSWENGRMCRETAVPELQGAFFTI
jgi:hypothetical protein